LSLSVLGGRRATVAGNLPPNFVSFLARFALVRSFTDLPAGRGLGCPRAGGKYREVRHLMRQRVVRVDQLP
jgi:hypothetical protein